jgi:5'-nucleotidase
MQNTYRGGVASSRRLRALITNDDGIDSPGLHALAGLARDAGFDVVVAAPHEDASGVSASVKAMRAGDGAVRLHRHDIPSLPGIEAYAVEAHPAFIVHASGRGWLDPEPDIVLSGVNFGANVGRAVLHSGTVGAALTASLHGWRAIAFSLDSGWEIPENPHWDAVAHVLPQLLDVLLAADEGTVLSVNVPDRPAAELGPLREARLSEFGMATITVRHHDEVDASVLRATADGLVSEPDPESDVALLAAGHPTVTSLVSVAAHPGVLQVAGV